MPELMALNKLSTSLPNWLIPEPLLLSLVELLDDVLVDEPVLGVAYVSSVVSALCAPEMLLSPSAVDTLERNSPSGLFEATLEGSSFSTWARYFFASAVSPDLIADIRLLNALSNELLLLVEELDDVLKAESSEISELVF